MNVARWRPDETRDVTLEDGLGVTIEGGVVWFWTKAGWRRQPNEAWAWRFFRGDWGARFWAPKLLPHAEYLQHQEALHSPVHWRLTRISTARWDQMRAQAMLLFPSRPIGDENRRSLAISAIAPGLRDRIRSSKDRKLRRACRLVCRDWALQLPPCIPRSHSAVDNLRAVNLTRWCPAETRDVRSEDGLGVMIERGVVRFWTEEGWQCEPNEVWAWHFLQGDRGTRFWAPKPISTPSRDWSLKRRLEKTSDTRWEQIERLVPGLAIFYKYDESQHRLAKFAAVLGLFRCIRGSGNKESYKTCRLVCRSWMRQFRLYDPVGWKVIKPKNVTYTYPDGVKVMIQDDGVQFYLQERWQRQANELWAWRLVCPRNWWWTWAWVPKLLTPIEYWQHHRQRVNTRLSTRLSEKSSPSATAIIAPRLAKIIRRFKDVRLCMTCRLVCRDWAKQSPLGRSQPWNLRVQDDGVAWYRMDMEWRHLPNSFWAWSFQELSGKWWVYSSRYWDEAMKSRRGFRGHWYPKLLVDDLHQPTQHCQTQSHSRQSNTHTIQLGADILLQFLEFLRRSADKKLCRTCRLVCRDWTNVFPVRGPKNCDWRVENDVIWHWIDSEWRVLPSTSWAWAMGPFVNEWWAERRSHQPYWFPKLVRPVDDSVKRSPMYPSARSLPLSSPQTSKQPRFLNPRPLPPELFKDICDAADNESWSLRLVCQYWNRQCTPRVFKQINVKQSPERIRALWNHRMDPPMRHVKLVENVPNCYVRHTKFPWIHLLSQTCTSTRSVWKGAGQSTIVIDGEDQFDVGCRTIRSVHFSLPRSLPRSQSRGIKSLTLYMTHHRLFEDLIHLACELPDLEDLFINEGSFDNDSFNSIELPRRRRKHNKLKQVTVWVRNQDPMLPLHALTLRLYSSVYDATFFFSDVEIAILHTLIQLLGPTWNIDVSHEGNLGDHSRRLDFKREYSGDLEESCTMFSLQILQDAAQNYTKFHIIADFHNESPDKDLDFWARLNTEFSKISGLIQQVDCVFGFANREDMVHFAVTILEAKMPSILRLANVRYSIHEDDGHDKDEDPGWWYQASLDSEELTGTGEADLAQVYS